MEMRIGMKQHITILEDEEVYCAQLKKLLKQWGAQKGLQLSIRYFTSGEDLLRADYNEDELFFLDINLETMNGIEIAKRLRSNGFQGSIIFLTAFSEYVFDGYRVQAMNYLLKPITYEKLEDCLKPFLKSLRGSYYRYRDNGGLIKIPYNKILAFTAFRHYVDIITQLPTSAADSTPQRFSQKIAMKDLQQQLPDEFVRCHRGVIVNMNKVMSVTCRDVTLIDGSVYPVSESRLQEVREAFARLLE